MLKIKRQLPLGLLMFSLLAITTAAVLAADEKKVDLNVGDEAPKFVSVGDDGKPWKSEDYVGKKIVVVYFYPADLTGGCTKQACGFRDGMKKLQKEGVEVVGVSGDSVENHKLFKKSPRLELYPARR